MRPPRADDEPRKLGKNDIDEILRLMNSGWIMVIDRKAACQKFYCVLHERSDTLGQMASVSQSALDFLIDDGAVRDSGQIRAVGRIYVPTGRSKSKEKADAERAGVDHAGRQ